MTRPLRTGALALLAGFAAGCATTAGPTLLELLARAEPGQTVRLTLDGTTVATIAAPIDPREIPALARTTIDAIAPEAGCTLQFCGQERGERGAGYRIERQYAEPVEHLRSVLVTAAGQVLERSHTLPLGDVPQHVLAAALEHGTFVESAAIVSGPADEEYWHVLVRNRNGRVTLVRVGLAGEELAVRRRTQSRVDS